MYQSLLERTNQRRTAPTEDGGFGSRQRVGAFIDDVHARLTRAPALSFTIEPARRGIRSAQIGVAANALLAITKIFARGAAGTSTS